MHLSGSEFVYSMVKWDVFSDLSSNGLSHENYYYFKDQKIPLMEIVQSSAVNNIYIAWNLIYSPLSYIYATMFENNIGKQAEEQALCVICFLKK